MGYPSPPPSRFPSTLEISLGLRPQERPTVLVGICGENSQFWAELKFPIFLFSDWQKAFVKMAEFKGIKPTEYDPKPEDSESTGSGLSIMIL